MTAEQPPFVRLFETGDSDESAHNNCWGTRHRKNS